MLNIHQIYHEELRNAIARKFAKVFIQATRGTCLKLSNLSLDDMIALRKSLSEKYSDLMIVILAEQDDSSQGYVSATHLIELRNSEEQALLALIPSGLQTPAEDSYGNATFNDLDISNIDGEIISELYAQVPSALHDYIMEALRNSTPGFDITHLIFFLLTIRAQSWEKSAIGYNLDYFGLIPDTTITNSVIEWSRRLVYHRRCAGIINDFSLSVPDRIRALPISEDSNQRELASFLNNIDTTDKFELMHEIHNSPDFAKLDFACWELPEIENSALLKISVGDVQSKEFVYDGTDKVLRVQQGKNVSVKIRINTDPAPKDFPTLKTFKIKLVTTDGHEEYKDVKTVKVTENNRSYRDVTIKISANVFEEGTFYFRIVGEDESGAQLNTEDDFRDEHINSLWLQEKETKGTDANYQDFKDQHQAKTTNETDDLRLQFIEGGEVEDDGFTFPPSRKDKLANALQAYFRYRIDGLKSTKNQEFPQTTSDTALWQNTSGLGLQSTFLLKFGVNHNYQIQISSKLRELERIFLEHCSEIGNVECTLHVNSTNASFPYKDFIPFTGDGISKLLCLRDKVFRSIMASAPEDSGIFETWLDLARPEVIDLVREYIRCYTDVLNQFQNNNTPADVLEKVQNWDIVDIQTQVDDGQNIHVKLLSPLHPLRLTWFINLWDLFTSWENKTIENKKHKKEWTKELIGLFLGDIYPSNNTLILANNSLSYYQYAGELSFGWGIFFESENKKANLELSCDRQVKIYISELLNLACESRIDSDVSQTLIERYILDYLKQHPYTSKAVINIFNPGDGASFVKAIVALEQKLPDQYQYEFRLCCENSFVAPGEAFRDLMNPESNVSDKAENFSSVAANRLFPKIRFSLNKMSDFVQNPFDYVANLSFLINPFSAKCDLLPVDENAMSDSLNGLIVKSQTSVHSDADSIQWWRTVFCSENSKGKPEFYHTGNQLLNMIQQVTAAVINPQKSKNLYPGTVVAIKAAEKTLLSLIHDCSDWVITFDKSIGPEIFDSKNDGSDNPYLLDYIPSRELNGISAFLTTKPEMEAYSFLYSYLQKIGLDSLCDPESLLLILEDIRTISGSLLLQAISTNNKAFEVIGMALTKRLLEKKGYLNNAFLVPLDLHKDLFNLQDQETKERADLMVVQIDPKSRELHFDVVEIKCRATLIGEEELFVKISEQINRSIEAFKKHFEFSENSFDDRLDRAVKSLELQNLLEFYIKRAGRFGQLSDSAEKHYLEFCKTLNDGYSLTFGKLQIIYNFSAEKDHEKIESDDFTRYIIGRNLISDIVTAEGTLATFKLEDSLRKFDLPIFVKPGIEGSHEPEKESQTKSETQAPKDQNNESSTDSALPVTDPSDSQKTEIVSEEKKNSVQESATTNTESTTNNSVIEPVKFDTIIGGSAVNVSQLGLLGIQKINNKKIALDLAKTTAISLFGVQGAGKSYTIGTVAEMVLKQIKNVNQLPSPLAGVIFHYSESMDYAPEFTSMNKPNDNPAEIEALLDFYNAQPASVQDIVLLAPKDKIEERKEQYPNLDVQTIAFSSKELDVASWLFLLGAVGNEALYIKQVKALMKSIRNNLTLENIRKEVQKSSIPDEKKNLIEDRLNLAQEYINDDFSLKDVLRPGRLVVVDLRDEFIEKDDALKLFVVMLNVFSGVKAVQGQHFNKFIVFDEAHKYMDNKELSSTIATAIKEMRHKGVSIMIASQDPTGLPPEIIELSSILIMHRFNSPAWLKHIQKAITQTAALTPADLAGLKTGEAFIWANESSDPQFTSRPLKVKTRPRATKHGGATINATDNGIS